MADVCVHRRRVCSECVVVTDAARRAYDAVQVHVWCTEWEERIRGWVALKLQDGSSDGVLYDSRGAAVRHVSDQRFYAFFSYRNAPNGFSTQKDAQLYLDYHRMAYDQGALQALADPDDHRHGGRELIIPTAREQIMVQRAVLLRPY